MPELLATEGTKLELSVVFDSVSLILRCGDSYAAQVLYEDLKGRLSRGDQITIEAAPPVPDMEAYWKAKSPDEERAALGLSVHGLSPT